MYLVGALNGAGGDGTLLPTTIPGEPCNMQFTFDEGRIGAIEP